MKNSVIQGIFNGVKGHIESMTLPKTNQDNLTQVSDAYDKLKARFHGEQMKLIDEFLKVYDDNYCDEIDFYFAEGFKLGLQIGVECFEDREE